MPTPAAPSRPALSRRAAARRIYGLTRPYRRKLVVSFALIPLSVGFSLIWPFLFRVILDDALPHHDTTLLGGLCASMAACGLAAGALSITQGWLANSVGQAVVHDLRVLVYTRAQSQPLPYYAAASASEAQTRMASDIGGISDTVTDTAQVALAALVMLLAAGIAMIILSPLFGTAAMSIVVVLGVLNARYSNRRRDLATRSQTHMSGLLRAAGEDLTLGGVLTGRVYGRTGWQRDRFTADSRSAAAYTVRQRMVGRVVWALIGAVMAVIPPAVYWLAGTGTFAMSLGTAVAIVTLQSHAGQPMRQLLALSGDLNRAMAMFDRVFEYLDLPQPADRSPRGAADPARTGDLVARDLSYGYTAGARPTVEGFSAVFPQGSTTFVGGPSGSGKSTLGLLLAGLLEPDGGSVTVGGGVTAGGSVTAGGVTADAPRHVEPGTDVVLVPQEPVIFAGTLRDNLLFARPEATGADLDSVLRATALDGMVARLPDGLDTAVGERGHQLSGGERQRLALARALLVAAPVLIVDEATSSLDEKTADLVLAAVRDRCRGRTLIIISHRRAEARAHDRSLTLDGSGSWSLSVFEGGAAVVEPDPALDPVSVPVPEPV